LTTTGAELALLRASVCICTRNRPRELERALASIAASSRAAHQVVVSDDDQDEEAAAVVAASRLPITYLHGPGIGLGANRNCAAAAAQGDFLLFLDDDALLGEDYLLKMEQRLRELPPARRPRTILAGVERNRGHTVVPNEQDLLGFQSRPYRGGEPLRTVVINAALFPRQLLEEVSFDPSLRYGFDEVDFTTQAVALGYSILPCFEAVNEHLPSPSGREAYAEAAIAARLYVTLKRRRLTEGSPLRAWLGFGLASAHLVLASVRRLGLTAGTRTARQAIGTAWSDYDKHKRQLGLVREDAVS
jgi:glycosyltransferase involved in cell wall biosynthesis